MNEKVTVYLAKILEYIKKLDKKKKILYIAILCAILAVTILTVVLLNVKNYVVLYRGLDTKECAEIVDKLDELKIPSKVENENTIYVDKKSEPTAKLQLASEGYPKSALNYDIFTNNIDFMTTDYEKTKYNLFQLQERLQASIKTLDNVNDAIVNITMPDNSLAVLEEDKVKASAAVILNLNKGVTLSEKQIKGVEMLVARSVPGLSEEEVTISDQTMAVINDKSEDATETISNTKTKLENELSNTISAKISKMLEPLYGQGKISVGVNAVLDLNKKVSEKIEYTPSKDNTGVIKKYEQTYEGSGNGTGAGAVPGTETNTEVPGYQTQTQETTSGSVKNQVSVDYSVSQLTEQIQKDGAEIKDITVSVLIDKEIMPAEEMDKITGIVANVAGVDKKKVELYNTSFNNSADEPTQPAISDGIFSAKYLPIYLIVLALIVVGLLVFFVLKKRKEKKKEKQELLVQQELLIEEPQEKEFELADIEITESKEKQLAREIKEFSLKSPEITANLLRTLLKGDLD
ncbi:MAG: fliF [Oscillospiraceae bacterium]|jgi:flagellar M-ring protein FliF|nr:fliF [Oscillospiraceae bacterium]